MDKTDDTTSSSFYGESSSRTRLLLGDEALMRLRRASVLICGVGGVGGYVTETLVRSGVGRICVVDSDNVAPSNLNRQLIATNATVGESKTELWRRRMLAINPDCRVEARDLYITPENVADLTSGDFDYVADCIDTIAPKVALLRQCVASGISVVSSMGAGGRLDPSQIAMGDLWQTRQDGLARAVRQAFKRLGEHPRIKVVWSAEPPRKSALIDNLDLDNKRSSFGTLATIPAMFGLWMANHIILELSGSATDTH